VRVILSRPPEEVYQEHILDREQIKELTLSVVAQDKAPAAVQKSATATVSKITYNICTLNNIFKTIL